MKLKLSIIIVCLLCTPIAIATDVTIRQPAFAGPRSFYPSDPAALTAMVTGHLSMADSLPEIDGDIIALIVPHAGLVYSGAIAAHGYKLLEGSGINRVILCGPSHRYGFSGCSVYGPDIVWRTPLGDIPCDRNLCEDLLGQNGMKVVPEAHTGEHCLEVQLPYLQKVLADFSIVPVVMGYTEPSTIRDLTRALSTVEFDDHTVMVASSDWQHYRPADVGWPMDSLGIDCLLALDGARLQQLLLSGAVEMCGGGAAVAVIKTAAARGANRVKLLRYGDSGDVDGRKSRVVGYVAAVVYRSDESSSSGESETTIQGADMVKPETYQLSETEKQTLLAIARKSIESVLADEKLPEFEVGEKLTEPGAAFVTLKKRGQLRGCIGHTVAVDPLYKTVSRCAIAAATRDQRFHPVTPDELRELHIECSVLTPLREIKSLDEIEVGRDGLMIFLGNQRGLLLPQVASDYGWNRTEFLENTCRKAGLPPDAYKDEAAVIYSFQALVFGE